MLDRPILFLATADPDRARDFFESRLGLEFQRDEPFALVFRAGAAPLRIQKVAMHQPAQHTVLGWLVADLNAEVRRLTDRGIEFERYGNLPQDELGIWTGPGGARVAWFRDPDGNVLSLTEDPSAA